MMKKNHVPFRRGLHKSSLLKCNLVSNQGFDTALWQFGEISASKEQFSHLLVAVNLTFKSIRFPHNFNRCTYIYRQNIGTTTVEIFSLTETVCFELIVFQLKNTAAQGGYALGKFLNFFIIAHSHRYYNGPYGPSCTPKQFYCVLKKNQASSNVARHYFGPPRSQNIVRKSVEKKTKKE